LDTVQRRIQNWVENDSFAIITYRERWPGDSDIYEQTYKFPKKKEFDSLTEYQLLDTETFYFEERDYRIIKYLFDDKDADDEEMLFFYSPEFGILVFRSAWWGNYERLTVSDHKVGDRITFYLIEMIANNDKEFFFNWSSDVSNCR